MNRRQLLQSALGSSVAAALVGVHRACQANADLDGGIRQPFLSHRQRQTIAAIAECIMPRTDTPGAADAGVPAFIELMLSDWYTTTERAPVVDGIDRLDRHCQAESGAGFADCAADGQVAALTAFADTPFFDMLKQLTVYGYYTSEIGAAAELAFRPAPGRYTTIDFAEVGRQWVR